MRSKRTLVAGILAICALQYFVVEFITASAWTNPSGYSWANNYISDLGVPECFSAEQLGRVVCSPLAPLMNASFVLQGLLILSALIALWSALPKLMRRFVAPLVVVHALGIIVVGLFPGSLAENLDAGALRMIMHSIGAGLALLGGNLMIGAAAVANAKLHPRYALGSAILGLLGLIGTVAFFFGQNFGLGVGGIERLAVNPTVIWIALTGTLLLIRFARKKRTPLFAES